MNTITIMSGKLANINVNHDNTGRNLDNTNDNGLLSIHKITTRKITTSVPVAAKVRRHCGHSIMIYVRSMRSNNARRIRLSCQAKNEVFVLGRPFQWFLNHINVRTSMIDTPQLNTNINSRL